MNAPLPRHLHDVALEVLDTFPALVIQGARQVGKSTFAQQLVAGRHAVITTLDAATSLAAATADPASFVRQAGEGILVIDEIQRAPNLLLAVKAEIDANRRPGRFILTGSSNLLRLAGNSESLAGRAITAPLQPFSQGELRGTHDDLLPRLRAGVDAFRTQSRWRRNDYLAAISHGGYPEVQSLTQRMRNTWFDSYVERLLERDVTDIAPRVDHARLGAALRLLAANNAGELVKAHLARDIGVSETTAASHVELLETLYLVRRLPPWTPNLTKREVGRPKVLLDSGLALRLARVTPGQLASFTSPHLGPAVEAFVTLELTKQCSWSAEEYELFHFRDRDGAEVDIVAEFADGAVVGIEVKSSATVKSEHFHGLRVLRDRLGARFVGGFVLNMAPSGASFGDRLAALPITALWE